MTKKLEIYKCAMCGNVVQVLLPGMGELVCCGKPMKKLEIQNEDNDERTEKHAPIVTKHEDGEIEIKITDHPMDRNHLINFIETISKDKNDIKIKYFGPCGNVYLKSKEESDGFTAISYCNVHGLYQNK